MPELPPPPAAPLSWSDRLARWRDAPPAVAFVAGCVVVAAIAAAWFTVGRVTPPPAELSLPRAISTEQQGSAVAPSGPPHVHVAGAVAKPGVYRLLPGARVADAIDAAGGPTADADVDALNLATKVADGDRVYVPRRGEAPVAVVSTAGGAGAASTSGPLDLNSATAEQLDALPGVGPATAAAIIDHRRQHGRFKSVDELLEVRGIGEARLASLRPKVRV